MQVVRVNSPMSPPAPKSQHGLALSTSNDSFKKAGPPLLQLLPNNPDFDKMRISSSIAALACCIGPSLAARLTLTLGSSPPLLQNPSALPSSTHATILSEQGDISSARLNRNNELLFSSVTPGSHLLSIYTHDLVYPQYRVDVTPISDIDSGSPKESIEVVQTFRGNTWDNKGPLFGKGNDTLSVVLTPIAKRDFYQERAGFNVLSLLKNPMILMAVLSAGLVFGMPYLMENMDEETKAELEEAQKKSPMANGDAAAAIQNFDIAGWLAGKSSSSAAEEKKPSSGAGSLR